MLISIPLTLYKISHMFIQSEHTYNCYTLEEDSLSNNESNDVNIILFRFSEIVLFITFSGW